jgi:hypothetical protein
VPLNPRFTGLKLKQASFVRCLITTSATVMHKKLKVLIKVLDNEEISVAGEVMNNIVDILK